MPRFTRQDGSVDDVTPAEVGKIRDSLLGVTRQARAERELAWVVESRERRPGPRSARETPPRKADRRKRLTGLELAGIRGHLADGILTYGAIAKLAGVSRSTISRIAKGKTGHG